jgi:hypothetical protein
MLQATRGCEDNIDANLNVDLSLVIVETSDLHAPRTADGENLVNGMRKEQIETYTTLEYDSIGLLCYCGGSSMEIRRFRNFTTAGNITV